MRVEVDPSGVTEAVAEAPTTEEPEADAAATAEAMAVPLTKVLATIEMPSGEPVRVKLVEAGV